MTWQAFPCYPRLGCENRISFMLFWLPFSKDAFEIQKENRGSLTLHSFLFQFTKCLLNARKKARFIVNYLTLLSLQKFPPHLTRDTFALHVKYCPLSRIVVYSKVNFIKRGSTRSFFSTGESNDSRRRWIAFWERFTRKTTVWTCYFYWFIWHSRLVSYLIHCSSNAWRPICTSQCHFFTSDSETSKPLDILLLLSNEL